MTHMSESAMFKFPKPTTALAEGFELVFEEDEEIDELNDQQTTGPNSKAETIINSSPEKRMTLTSQPRGLFGMPNDIPPLAAIELYERRISLELGEGLDLESKFVLTNLRTVVEDRAASVEYSVLDPITDHCFPYDDGELPMHNGECWGSPQCIAMFSPKYVAVGTSQAKVIVFENYLTKLQVLGTDKEAKYGRVTCIDISAKDDKLIAGYENGNMVLWSLLKSTRIKTIKPPEKCSILNAKFLESPKAMLIASTSRGPVYTYKIEDAMFKPAVSRTHIYPSELVIKNEEASMDKNFPDGFYDIQIMPREYTRKNGLDRYSLIALASMKKVVIITLDPTFGIVHTFFRSPDVIPTSISCAHWGIGGVPDQEDNKLPILALSWGKNLNLFQIEKVGNEEHPQINIVGHYFSDADIVHIEWFSEGNLLIYNASKELKVLSSISFRSIPHLDSGLDFDYSQVVIDAQLIDARIRYQTYHYKESRSNWPVCYYSNTIKGITASKRVLVMGDKKMFKGAHLEWTEYVQNLIDRAEWLSALTLCVEIFKGNVKKYSGIPSDFEARKKAIAPVSTNLIKLYINSVRTNEETDQKKAEIWETIILTAIDFLVSVENYNCLFGDMVKIFNERDYKKLFLLSLEPFILKNRISYITRDILSELIPFYVEQGKKDVVQYLIINLPLKHINFGDTVMLCMQYKLLTALMYLCSHKSDIGEPDFITPISKALVTFQQGIAYANRNGIETKTIDVKEDGVRFLWFLNLLMQARIFPNGGIPQEIWRTQLKEILIILFEETNVDMMIRADSYTAFEIFKMLFEPTCASVIQSVKESPQRTGSFRKSKTPNEEVDPEEEVRDLVSKFKQCFKSTFQGKMLGLIYYCGTKEQKYQNYLYYTLGDLIVYFDYDLPMEAMEKCTYYIIQFPRGIPKWEANKRKIEGKDEDEWEQKRNEERSHLALGLIKKIKAYITSTKLEKVTRLAEQANFVDVRVHLLEIKQDYRKGLDLYLTQTNKSQQFKVFKWLDHMIPFLKQKDPAHLEQLKEAIVYRVEDLVTINTEKARKIILLLDKNLEIEALYRLEAFPQLQLEFLERILDKREDGYVVPDNLLVLHVKLLCQIGPKQVLYELQIYEYPTDECIKICREKRVDDALAFLLENAGNIYEAVQIHVEIFMKSARKKLNKILYKEKFSRGNLPTKFYNALEICIRHSNRSHRDGEKLWFHFLDQVLEYSHDNITAASDSEEIKTGYVKRKCFNKFTKLYSSFVSSLFNSMSKCISVESLMAKLNTHKGLKVGELRASLSGIIKTYNYERTATKTSNILIKGDIQDTFKTFSKQASRAIINNTFVFDDDKNDKMMIFNCGHAFSKSHIEAKMCVICADSDKIKAQHAMIGFKKGGETPSRDRASIRNFSASVAGLDMLMNDRQRLGTVFNVDYIKKRNIAHAKVSRMQKLDDYDKKLYDKGNTWDPVKTAESL